MFMLLYLFYLKIIMYIILYNIYMTVACICAFAQLYNDIYKQIIHLGGCITNTLL